MATPFLSSEEYDERAHQLYNEGQYDDALTVLREGLMLYPNSVELHVGVGYAQLAREEYAWARHSFEQALVLEPEHEDGLAGLGETLLKLGQDGAAQRCFRRTLELGYADDVDLMLQIGRSLFREGSLRDNQSFFETAKEFFETASQQVPDSAEAVACVGYAQHRLGDDDAAIGSLRRSLQLDSDHAEARIYLANILYDQGEYEAALYHFERTNPEDHWDELGIWRLIELKRSLYRLEESDPELKPWDERLSELAGDLDDVDAMLMELEPRSGADTAPAAEARGQLELFGTLLNSLVEHKQDEEGDIMPSTSEHQIIAPDGTRFEGAWEDIVRRMRDEIGNPAHSVQEYMSGVSQHGFRQTGVRIPTHDAESFLRGSAKAGLLRIVR
ncbi:MAG TPA: tetratricopeptide repeat protein [Gemmatimonadaceae bacterium]|jgi:Tfp pilus assembly protein PilF|nr:tetratricopeptide repeat protein [Gemmatimonadaceae bacterium]